MQRGTIGIDFGTESARAVLVDVTDGRVVTTATAAYPHGVIDRTLPGSSPLPPDYALQDPQDWLAALETLLRQMAAAAPAGEIIGIGIDFTSCTVLPVTADGTPLCTMPDYRGEPHAWPKLWKHHAAQPYADRINAAAGQPGSEFLGLYGGKTSSEWLWAKGWQFLAEAPSLAGAATRWIEGGDWIAWQLVGREVRSACQAGYKAHWQKDRGYPSAAFLNALDPELSSILLRLGPPRAVGSRAGTLSPEWARRTGLRPGVAVAVAVIDAHAGMPAIGISEPGNLMAIMGTSTCHLVVDPRRSAVRGISGVVEDGILPGLFGYEAGQAAVGDIFQWQVRASRQTFPELEAGAGRLRPGECGVLALDWWNGCRTPLVDADLSGMLVGLTLATEPPHTYRALLESTAFGTRRVIETFEAGGVAIREVHACGGLAERSPLLLQLTADILGREVLAAPLSHASAVGAAIYAAAAAGEQAGGYTDVVSATRRMGSRERVLYTPRADTRATYEVLYRHYVDLAQYFGEGGTEVMKALRRFRSGSENPAGHRERR